MLRAEGYAVISLSGGEPLVYPPLRTVVERSRGLGFRVTMVSNGLLATDRMAPVLSLLDGMAISFDGMAASHNALRGRPDAFERACATLQRLAAMGRPVAAAISLTRDAIPELPDLADHLLSLGARALQIRPVARAGRARSLVDSSFCSANDHARLYLVVLALQQEPRRPALGRTRQSACHHRDRLAQADRLRLRWSVRPLHPAERGPVKDVPLTKDNSRRARRRR